MLSFRPGLANNLSWIAAELCILGHSANMCGKEVPIWFQREPHVSGSGKLAVQVKGVRLDRTHLHLADVEAHAINFVRPLTQTAIAREEYGNLRFFCTTTKPRTSCFLLEYASKKSFLKSGELLQDVIDGKVQPINFELANECGEILFRIHRPKMEVQFSTLDRFASLGD